MAKYKAKASKGAVAFVGIIAFLAVLGVVAIALGLASNWGYWIPKKYLPGGNGGKDDVVAVAPAANMTIQQTENDGIMLFSAPMALADFEVYDISPYADNVQTLTATLSPADTTLQKVDFAGNWKNPNSTWAKGKVFSDYVQLTQSEDGALTCAVSALQPFGEPGVITCTARALNEGDYVPSATCTVNYYRRYESIKPLFQGNTYDSEGEDTYSYSITLENGSTVSCIDYYAEDSEGWQNNHIYIRDESATRTAGTISDVIDMSTLIIKVSIADDIANSIKNAAGVSSLSKYDLSPTKITSNTAESNGFKIRTAINNMLGGASNVNSHRVAIYNAFKSAYDAGRDALKFEVTFTTRAGFNYSFNINLKMNPTALGVKASGVSLDKPNLDF